MRRLGPLFFEHTNHHLGCYSRSLAVLAIGLLFLLLPGEGHAQSVPHVVPDAAALPDAPSASEIGGTAGAEGPAPAETPVVPAPSAGTSAPGDAPPVTPAPAAEPGAASPAPSVPAGTAVGAVDVSETARLAGDELSRRLDGALERAFAAMGDGQALLNGALAELRAAAKPFGPGVPAARAALFPTHSTASAGAPSWAVWPAGPDAGPAPNARVADAGRMLSAQGHAGPSTRPGQAPMSADAGARRATGLDAGAPLVSTAAGAAASGMAVAIAALLVLAAAALVGDQSRRLRFFGIAPPSASFLALLERPG